MNSKFLYIHPKTKESEIIFEEYLNKLHSCKILEKQNDKILVKSIAGDYYFWINKSNDKFWKVTY